MARKFYDLASRGAEYQGRDGEKKHRFHPAGKLCVEDDGRMWINLEWPGVNMMVSVFEQKPREDTSQSSGSYADAKGGKQPAVIDDDIPF